jgi:hypothetical protein
MNNILKVILSIPSFLVLIIVIDFWSTDLIFTSLINVDYYNIVILNLLILKTIVLFYLFSRLWRNQHIDKKYKTRWTFIMIFLFSPISTLYYIWRKDHELGMKNTRITLKQNESDSI